MTGIKTFPGGIHPDYNKTSTTNKATVKAALPATVVVPLHQHTGAPCEPLVKVGDEVKAGQKIGDTGAFVAAPVHASISGKVVAIEPRPHPALGQAMAVVIESDGRDELDPGIRPAGSIADLSRDDIRKVIREAGIVGMGGAAFPTAVKVAPPPSKKIDSLMLNGAECEPYLTADHRLMLEQPGEIIYGLLALMKACGAERGFLAVEDNKLDAVEALKGALSGAGGAAKIILLHTKYPQGSEKHLIKACLGREVPSGGLPLDVGVVVNNVGTAAAVARAIRQGTPLYERVLTVTGGAVANPQNLLVRIGATFRDLIEQCGGFSRPPGKVINGGPMMGIAQPTLDVPVIKGTSGILCMARDEVVRDEPEACLKCGRCIEACPMNLMPLWIAAYAERGRHADAERYDALDCVECGACAYVCPSRRPLVQAIRLAKGDITARRRRQAQAAKK
jgi:electron transport complex protein RnfC